MELRDVTSTVQIHTNHGTFHCPDCGESVYVGTDKAINHMLGHGYKLLHVGSEWGEDREGKSVSHTVALLGK